jgi:hypothetical protein
MQARLPESRESIGLKDMIEGETAYTMSWAMYADYDGFLWLNGNYPIRSDAEGTATMKVTKKNGNYIVDISGCRNFSLDKSGAHFAGEFTPLPVAELLGA